MGDGIQRSFAIILNGDTETRHLENVDRAIATLQAEGVAHVAVASTSTPKIKPHAFAEASAIGLAALSAGIHADDDDSLTVYVTGHGNQETGKEACIDLGKSCLPFSSLKDQLDKIQYGKRAIVMDNCFSGGTLALFANEKTTIVTQGSAGETVSCQNFSPYFWSQQAPDFDGNGIVTLQERYRHAIETGKTESHSQFYEPNFGLSLAGKTTIKGNFSQEVKEVHDGKQLTALLSQVKAGELALVTFSADWCGPCQAYKPEFEKLAKDFQGKFLMIRAEGKNGTENDWTAFGVNAFPTVAFVDYRGNVVPVKDRHKPTDNLLQSATVGTDERLNEALKKFKNSTPDSLIEDIDTLASLGPAAKAAIPELIEQLGNENSLVQQVVVYALLQIDPQLFSDLERIWEMNASPKRSERVGAALILGLLAKNDSEICQRLLKSLHDQDHNRRSGAALALGEANLGAKELFAMLRTERNEEVRTDAIFAIGCSPNGYPFLSSLVRKSHGKSVAELSAMMGAIWALGEAKTEFKAFLNQFLREENGHLAGFAAITLTETGNAGPQDFPMLLWHLQIENQRRLDMPFKKLPMGEFLFRAFSPENQPVFTDFQSAIIRFVKSFPTSFPQIVDALNIEDQAPYIREENQRLLVQCANQTPSAAAELVRSFGNDKTDIVTKKNSLSIIKKLDRATLWLVFKSEVKNPVLFQRLYSALEPNSPMSQGLQRMATELNFSLSDPLHQ